MFALCGFCFYIGYGANGAAEIANYSNLVGDEAKALAAMCIITSVAYLVDFVYGIINLKNEIKSKKIILL